MNSIKINVQVNTASFAAMPLAEAKSEDEEESTTESTNTATFPTICAKTNALGHFPAFHKYCGEEK